MLGLIQAGDRFSGRFTFDTTSAPDGYGLGPWAIYPLLGFEMHVSERFDSVASAWQLHSISVTDDKERGYGELVVNAGLRLDPAHTLGVVLRIEASESTAFDGFRVPDGYDDFYGAGLFMSLYHYDHPMIDQVAASAQVALDRAPSAIPEPATGLLLLAGLAGLACLRRR
ncbi:PEP-CTERM sorting domain-containing protein [Massilia sp. YIM B02443]|uniref:PEP-CTERM sorting domain-containing protein n=1 Tax=Massilia sp. YIM B02443 TaxID=3050127 RepID=UPI0025B65934|nr:PEP-CTERM sorting domain-containing protein [Massilia sp. YIM B02443]MDN4039461.1 PEP-CTERM sorting domain-containing protein [Massilia sp. YIM B02443]